MSKILLTAVLLTGTLSATAIPASAGEYNSNNSSVSTTVINTTTNYNFNNNRYGRGYNRFNNRRSNGRNDYRYNYYGNYHRPIPSNQIQFRVPVRLNVFGSNIDLNIGTQNYPYYHH